MELLKWFTHANDLKTPLGVILVDKGDKVRLALGK